jgi:hypothetical protein
VMHATLADESVNESSHTVPHSPLTLTSSRPAVSFPPASLKAANIEIN